MTESEWGMVKNYIVTCGFTYEEVMQMLTTTIKLPMPAEVLE